MVRCDVPAVDASPAYTRFYGPGAIYSLTLVTEAVARAALKALRPEAVTVYIPPQIEGAWDIPHRQPDFFDEDDEENNDNDHGPDRP
jgi:hypothetical protein